MYIVSITEYPSCLFLKVKPGEPGIKAPVKERATGDLSVSQAIFSSLFLYSLVGSFLSAENRELVDTWYFGIKTIVTGDTIYLDK